MKKLLAIITALFSFASANANEYDALWSSMSKSLEKDMPKDAMATLDKIISKANAEKQYGELLAAELLHARVEAEVTPDSLTPAINRLKVKAIQAESIDPALSAIYNTVMAKMSGLAREDAEESADLLTPEQYYDKALSNPDLLASVTTDAYKRIIKTASDDGIYNHDMLSLIGHEAGRHAFLKEYYMTHGNPTAACIEHLYYVRNEMGSDDDMAITNKKKALNKGMEEFADCPVSALFAQEYFKLLDDDEDVSEQTSYQYLVDAIAKYEPLCANGKDEHYCNVLKNSLAVFTRPRFSLKIDNNITLYNIHNVKNLKVEFIQLKADGRDEFQLYREEYVRKTLSHATGLTKTVNLNYDRPEWETHRDTVDIPNLPYGVYVVKASTGNTAEYAMFYYSDLSVLALETEHEGDARIIVVSKTTGAPVAGAEVELTEHRYNMVDKVHRLTTDANGEILWKKTDGYYNTQIWVHAKDGKTGAEDKAFVKTSLRYAFEYASNINQYNILNLYTDRSIYRPGQTLKGAVIVHKATDTDDIHVIANQKVSIRLRNPDRKMVTEMEIVTDEMGNAGFEIPLPKDGKNGEYQLSAWGASGNTESMAIRVEEYKRPTFEVNALNPEKYDETIEVDPNQEAPTLNICFKANTYSQIPVQDASVTYSIKRELDLWGWWRFYYDDPARSRTVANNVKATTDADGLVSIPLTLSLPEKSVCRYRYVVSVKVTDKNGETHESVLNVSARHNTKVTEPKGVTEEKPEFEISGNSFPRDGGKLLFTMRNKKAAKTYAYYTVHAGKKLLESGVQTFTNEYNRTFTYSKEYGDALVITYVWLMDGKLHQFCKTILKPQPDLNLPVKWTTFRDRTQPGCDETWTLKVGNANEKPRAAITAAIYDASLDALYPTSWNISVITNSYYNRGNWCWMTNNAMDASVAVSCNWLNSKDKFYLASLNEDYLPYRAYYSRYDRRPKMRIAGGLMLESAPMAQPMMAKAMVAADSEELNEEVVVEAEKPKVEKPADLSGLVRQNLAETAFFTPSLFSDGDGNITLSFKMPETMTRWRLRGVVHDAAMRYAMLDTTCVAQKDIIVKPNVPRFFRESDNGIMAATVSNTTAKKLSADVVMQLLIPETNAVVWQKTEKVNVEAEKTAAVAFSIPSEVLKYNVNDSLLIYRIAATTAEGASDGEQHYIPLLPGTEEVTTSVAFTQHSPGVVAKDISDLFFKDSQNRTVCVSYTPHAVQMIIDAIPSVTCPERADALSLASASYVASLFNNNEDVRLEVTEKLRKMQTGKGAWPWWEGMSESVFTTTSVARLLARLELHGCGNATTKQMLTKTLPYLMKYINNEADALRKLHKKYPKEKFHPSETCTDILYIFALCRDSDIDKAQSLLSKKNKDVKYLLDLLEKANTEFTIYGKAHAAALLAYYGRTKKALEHLESMKQYSVCTEEAGRYYDSPKAYYSWRNYRIPTEVAAIEALRIVTPQDTLTIEEMKRWLLHEKRTQSWGNSINTADAVFAFLLDNEEAEYLKNNEPAPIDQEVTITLDGKTIAPDSVLNVSGASKVEFDKKTTGTSWGAVFVNQRAPLTSLKTMGSGMKIRREIISDKEQLCVGDRVTVRITIDADRDYDLVEVCDRRAACMEPVQQLSGYQSAVTGGTARYSYSGYYRITHDNNTEYFFDHLAKGTHVIETDYYIDRTGTYQQGSCTVACTYAPEYRALQAPTPIVVK